MARSRGRDRTTFRAVLVHGGIEDVALPSVAVRATASRRRTGLGSALGSGSSPAPWSSPATASSFRTPRISAYDSYQGLDVKDKIVVVLRYFPEDADQKTRAILARYADLRYKAQAARQRGAKGMVVVTGPRSPNAGNTVPMSFDTAIAGSGLVAVSISGDAAAPIFQAANKQLEAVQKELDGGNPHVSGFAIPNLQRDARTRRSSGSSRPAITSSATCRRRCDTGVGKPWVAVGAHYDHLGRGGAGNSLADKAGAQPDSSRR